MSLLQVEDLKVSFPVSGGLFGRTTAWVHAVDGVSLTVVGVVDGETVAEEVPR